MKQQIITYVINYINNNLDENIQIPTDSLDDLVNIQFDINTFRNIIESKLPISKTLFYLFESMNDIEGDDVNIKDIVKNFMIDLSKQYPNVISNFIQNNINKIVDNINDKLPFSINISNGDIKTSIEKSIDKYLSENNQNQYIFTIIINDLSPYMNSNATLPATLLNIGSGNIISHIKNNIRSRKAYYLCSCILVMA